MHRNQIVNLQHCEYYLPGNLEILTLASNNLTDLNEISHLVQLCNLKEISVSGNPCVSMTGNIAYPFTISNLLCNLFNLIVRITILQVLQFSLLRVILSFLNILCIVEERIG